MAVDGAVGVRIRQIAAMLLACAYMHIGGVARGDSVVRRTFCVGAVERVVHPRHRRLRSRRMGS